MGTEEDRLDILNLISRYPHAIDGPDPAAFADIFTEDGTFRLQLPTSDRVFKGREELTGFAKGVIAGRGSAQTRHLIAATSFAELSPERAIARSYMVITRAEPGKGVTVTLTGVYEDEVVRTPQGWRFKARHFCGDPQP